VGDAASLLPILVLHLALTALPLAAAALLAARLGLRSVPLLLAVGLAASGLVAILGFWAFYATPLIGKSFSYLVPLGSLALIADCLHGGRVERDVLRGLATPLALWALGSAFLVFLGFLHGGTGEPLQMAQTRFSIQLPPDNMIPGFFADWFYQHGHNGPPSTFPGEWLSSDRPPLQIGYVLTQRSFGWDTTGLHTQVLGVVLQQLWIVGLWALLAAARVGRIGRGLAVVAVLLSDVAIVHGFYIWPKLLPAAFLLAAAALVVTPLWTDLRRDPRAGLLVAVLVSLALLAHGASVFGAIPLVALALIRGLPSWRWVAVAVLAAVVLLAPWAAYQKYADPPGNRLTKWMLGGAAAIDDRGTLEAIADGYRKAGFGGTLDHKWNNFVTIGGGSPALDRLGATVDDVVDGDVEGAVSEIRQLFFFQLLPSLGLLLIAPFAMAIAWARGRRPDSPEWRLSLVCWAVVLVGCLTWGLLMFGGPQSNASIHVGSLLLPVLAICAAVVGLLAVLPRFALWYVGISALLTVALYVPDLIPASGSSFSPLAALLAAACLAGFVAVAFRGHGPSATANTLAR
jgi:hypothetical protein